MLYCKVVLLQTLFQQREGENRLQEILAAFQNGKQQIFIFKSISINYGKLADIYVRISGKVNKNNCTSNFPKYQTEKIKICIICKKVETLKILP